MWADKETKVDFLNYSEVAELTVDVIRNESMRPVSIGIFGAWGTGKSSLLNLIEAALDDQSATARFLVVRFDAWLYQGFDDSRAALMEVIASKLIDATDKNEGLRSKAKKLFKRVNRMRLLGILAEVGAISSGHHTGGALYGGAHALSDLLSNQGSDGDYEKIEGAAKEAVAKGKGLLGAAAKRTPPKEIAAFRKEFSELISGLGQTLVVFIDNLDRCLPTQTINTLEALRLFIFMENTAYVVAADEEMVRHSVSRFFADLDNRHVIDYLDKLIQVPIRLPRLGVQEVRSYLFLLFALAEDGAGTQGVERLRKGLEASLRESWRSEPISTEDALRLLGDAVPEQVVRGFRIADRIAPLLANSVLVAGNPRIVKRMLNVIRMRSRLAQLRGIPFDEALIAKLALFERCMDGQSIGHLYLAINDAAGGKPAILSELERLREDPDKFKQACPEAWISRSEFIREWISLEPLLSDIDLRPAVYLSRETIPVRAMRGGLSATAADSLKVLLRASSTSSPSAKIAVAAIPTHEQEAVMTGIIGELRKHGDWTSRPDGFHGAQLIALASPTAANALTSFIRHVVGAKPPPWLQIILKEAPWAKAADKR
jgi:predicted KAP-like P-loop ATPase